MAARNYNQRIRQGLRNNCELLAAVEEDHKAEDQDGDNYYTTEVIVMRNGKDKELSQNRGKKSNDFSDKE